MGLQITIYEPSEDGSTGRVSPPSGQTNKLLMRRYAAVQRARDADVIGLVVGTLGISSYLPLVSRIRHLLRAHQKKVYTLSVGKPTPAKLANYQEVECFVLIACPENSLLLLGPETSKEFYRPMVTPWEMEVALGDGSWDQGWRLGWKEPAKKHDDDEDASENEDEDVQFSAATGKLRTVRKYAQRPSQHSYCHRCWTPHADQKNDSLKIWPTSVLKSILWRCKPDQIRSASWPG